MDLNNYKSKIPVYYHIPKCGGTYILQLYSYLNRKDEKNKKKLPLKHGEDYICRLIDVYLNDSRYIQVIGIIAIDDLLKLDCKLESYQNILSIDHLYDLIDQNKIKLKSIFLQPTGDGNMLDSKHEVDRLLVYINKRPVYFTIIRDVFQRIYSEYYYLINHNAKHEPLHKLYQQYDSFENFLIHSNYYENQVTKHIVYNLPLNDTSFKKAQEFFDGFIFGDMKNLQNVATNVWIQCYGWADDCSRESFFKNENVNKKPLTLNTMSDEAIKQFLLKTKWDRKLYAYLAQK